MKMEKYKTKIKSLQRMMTLRICSAYITVSYEALTVLAGTIPLYLLAEERKINYDKRDEPTHSTKETRRHTVEKWQQEWRATNKAKWTRKLIKEIAPWRDRNFGEIDFHMTQCLTGHGCFMQYVARIGKRTSPTCMYCPNIDDAEHTLFSCPRWYKEKQELQILLGGEVNAENLVEHMLSKAEAWETIKKYMGNIMRNKEEDERKQEM